MNSFHLDWRFFLVFEIYFGHFDVFLQFDWREITGINIQIVFLSFFVGARLPQLCNSTVGGDLWMGLTDWGEIPSRTQIISSKTQ